MLGIRLLSQCVFGAVENPTGDCRFSEIGLYKFSRGGLFFLPKKKARPLSILRKRPAVPPFRRAKKTGRRHCRPRPERCFFLQIPSRAGQTHVPGFCQKADGSLLGELPQYLAHALVHGVQRLGLGRQAQGVLGVIFPRVVGVAVHPGQV